MAPSNLTLLTTALRLNGAFSLATGALLTFAPATVGGWLGVSIDGWLRLLGIALLGHAALLAWATRQDSIELWGRLNLAAVAPYPFILIGLVATGVVDTSLGRVLLLLDAAIVGAMAFAQWTGLRATTPERHAVAA